MRYLYSIRDSLIGFGSMRELPVILDFANDQEALRVVKDACAYGQKPNALNTHPEHKELWIVGTFDTETGVITPIEPHLIARAIDFIGKEVIADHETNNTVSESSDNA